METRKVLVCGAGNMGIGIAAQLGSAGVEVLVMSRSARRLLLARRASNRPFDAT